MEDLLCLTSRLRINGVGVEMGGRWGEGWRLGWGWGEKGRELYLNNNKIKGKKKTE